MKVTLSDNSILALYLALLAARKGATKIVLSNEALKTCLGKKKVHEPRINEFAASLRPIFPRHSLGKEGYGLKNRLILYLNEKDDPTIKAKSEIVKRLPNQAAIHQSLSIQVNELDTKRKVK